MNHPAIVEATELPGGLVRYVIQWPGSAGANNNVIQTTIKSREEVESDIKNQINRLETFKRSAKKQLDSFHQKFQKTLHKGK